MEKPGRSVKLPALSAAHPAAPATESAMPKRERRFSMFERDAYTQILKERLRESVHDVQYVEPPFDDSIADIGKEWKSALSKLKFANSYRMEPLKKFQAHLVETKIQQVLKEYLKDVKYDDKGFSHLSLELANQVLSEVKDFGYQRYKLIIKVLLVQKIGQAITLLDSPVRLFGALMDAGTEENTEDGKTRAESWSCALTDEVKQLVQSRRKQDGLPVDGSGMSHGTAG